jgi:hypothetical protein
MWLVPASPQQFLNIVLESKIHYYNLIILTFAVGRTTPMERIQPLEA